MFLSVFTYAFAMIMEAYRLGIPIGPDGLIQGLIGGSGFFLLVGYGLGSFNYIRE